MAVNGTTLTESAATLAESHLQNGDGIREAAESLVLYESLKACGSGFACGLAGGALLPLSASADICSTLFIQMRLCAAVAITGGRSTDDPRVRLLCWGAVAGDICADAISGIAIRLMNQTMTLPEAEAALLTTMRDGLCVNYGGLSLKESLLVSLLGGAVSGTSAWLVTRLTGQLAIRLFLPPPASPCAA